MAIALQPLPRLFELSARDIHPPLYYVLAGWWAHLFGPSPHSVKSFNVLLTLGLLSLLYKLGEGLAGRRAGLIALAFGAMSPTMIFSTWAIRDFQLAALLGGLSALSFARVAGLLDQATTGRRSSWIVYAVANALGLWTSYFHVAVMAAQAIFLIVVVRRWGLIGRATIAGLVSGALAAPWYLGLANPLGTLDLGAHVGAPGEKASAFVGALVDLPLELFGGGLAAAAVTISAGAWIGRQRPQPSPLGLYLGGAALLQIGVALAAGAAWLDQRLPIRYLLLTLPFVLPLAAAAVDRALTRVPVVGAAAFVLVAVSSAATLGAFLRATPFAYVWSAPEMAEALDAQVGPRDGVLFLSLQHAGYYAALTQAPRPWEATVVGNSLLERDVHGEIDRLMAGMAPRFDHLWVVSTRDGVTRPTGQLARERVSRDCYPMRDFLFGDHAFWQFLCGGEAVPMDASRETLGGQIQLAGTRIIRERAPRGALLIDLDWIALRRPDQDYAAFVHLLDGQGRLVAQHDGPVGGSRLTSTWGVGESERDRHLIMVPAELPAGDYQLVAGLYRGDFRLATGTGQTAVRLGAVSFA